MGSMAKKIEILLIEAGMNKKQLAEKLGTTSSNISGKLKRDNFSEQELNDIAEACGASFKGMFLFNEKEI